MKASVMKESKVKLSHCSKNLSQAVKKVLNIQMKMAEVFLKEKDARHLAEDPSILDPLSNIFDIRNWSMIAWDPFSEKNKNDESFEKDVMEMRKKIEAGKKFSKI